MSRAGGLRAWHLVAILCLLHGAQALRVVHYATNWAQYRSGAVGGTQCKWFPSNFPAELATHVNLAFASIDGSTYAIRTTEWNDAELYTQLQALKKRNPNLKTLVALGGWSFTDPGPTQRIFGDMVSSRANRTAFVASALAFTAQHGFDGIDFDWEYPGTTDRGGRPLDKAGLVALVRELRAATVAANRTSFLISMAVAASCPYGCEGLNLPALARVVDYFNLMTYDYNGAWATTTGALAPWKDPLGGPDISKTLDYYIKVSGVPPQKLNLGLPLYARAWLLTSAAPAGLGAAAAALSAPVGACTQEAGYLAWYEIKQLIAQGAIVKSDPQSKEAYLQMGTTWASFDLPQNIYAKIQAAKGLQLGGLMAWDASLDDGQNELLQLISSGVNPGPYKPYRQYSLQIVVSPPAGAAAASAAQRAAVASWAAPFAGVAASAIDVAAGMRGLLLTWISTLPAVTMAARARTWFSNETCPAPAILTRARQVQARLAPLPLKVEGFNLLGYGATAKLRVSSAVASVRCAGKVQALVTAANVEGALDDAQRQLGEARSASVVAAPPGTTLQEWERLLRSATGPQPAITAAAAAAAGGLPRRR